MNEELQRFLTLVFSAGGFVGYVKAKLKDLTARVDRLEDRHDDDIKELRHEKDK